MSSPQISKLTLEQEALLPFYRDKWRNIALSTKEIDRTQAKMAIQKAYRALGKPTPKIRFFASPNGARWELLALEPAVVAQELGAPLLSPFSLDLFTQIQAQIAQPLWDQLLEELQPVGEQNQQITQMLGLVMQQLERQLTWTEQEKFAEIQSKLRDELMGQFWQDQERMIREEVAKIPGGEFLLEFNDFMWENVWENVWHGLGEPLLMEVAGLPVFKQWEQEFKPVLEAVDAVGLGYSVLRSSLDVSLLGFLDYSISVLNCQYDRQKWEIVQGLSFECGWIFPFERTCLVCDRPVQLSFDEDYRLHGEGVPAIGFGDGYNLYAYQGVLLPDRYAGIHPNRWQAAWLLDEPNAELRRVLIQGIGYGRLCQELQAIELDSWREYTLLMIEQDVDIEPIYLLKMVCPSTNHIHALRVPPTMSSAREAIRWVNGGIDPEEFAIAT